MKKDTIQKPKRRDYRTAETGDALREAMREENTDQLRLALSAGLSQGTLSHIIAGRRRPEVMTLQAITHYFRSHENNLSVLVGHLRDECTRSGWPSGAVKITADKAPPSYVDALHELQQLRPVLAAELVSIITDTLRSARVASAAEKKNENISSSSSVNRKNTR